MNFTISGPAVSLDLTKQNLDSIPLHTFENMKVNWLILSNNNIRKIPSTICNFKELTRLAANDNAITVIENGLGKLRNLTWIDLTRNRLSSLPEDLSNLENLTGLGLSNNNFEEIPPCVYQMVNLKKFGCFSNRIHAVSPSIENLCNLVKIDLSNNNIERLPDEICKLKHLSWLNLSHNRLVELPKNIKKLRNLEELGLGSNNLTELPDFSGLNKLRILPVFKNKLKKIMGLETLTSLAKLDCSDNEIEEFPHEVIFLRNMNYLNLKNNCITEINVDVISSKALSQIKVIDLSENKLVNIPIKFFKIFSQLTMIIVENNPFKIQEHTIPVLKPTLMNICYEIRPAYGFGLDC